MNPSSPFPARRPNPRRGIFSLLWGIVAGLFDVRWLLGLQPAIVERPAPEGATVTIVIPARNEQVHLRQAVESLLKQTYPLYSIIVVDDGSTDRTGKIADTLAEEHPGLVFAVHTPGTGSKSGALNAGFDSGHPFGELTVVMDADTTFAFDAVEKALPYFYDPSVAVVCGHVSAKPPQGKKTLWWRAKQVEYRLGQWITKAAQNHFGAILVSSGCFSMYSTSLMGRFSSETMAEDMQKTWQLQTMGYRAVYATESKCLAAEPETFSIFCRQRWRWFCGFLQCYLIEIGAVVRHNARLAIVVHFMFAEAVLDIFLLPMGLLLFYMLDFEFMVLLPNALDIGVMVVALMFYAYREGGLRLVGQSLWSVPASLIGSLVIRGIFLAAIVSEWFMRKRLTKWAAGH